MGTMNYKKNMIRKMNSQNERGDRADCMFPSSAKNLTSFTNVSLIWTLKYTNLVTKLDT
jgi:hypothetical protein